MGPWPHTIAAFTVLATVTCGPAEATLEKPPPRTITVLVCDSVGIVPEVLATAKETAARAFRQIGVTILWRDKVDQTSPALADSSETEPGPPTVYLRLVPLAWQPAALTSMGAMGFTQVGGRVASVVLDRVLDLAAKASLDASHLLGYVIAHELGHVLLGSGHHAVNGLMSDTIDQRGCAQGQLWFSRDEAKAVRARLATTAE